MLSSGAPLLATLREQARRTQRGLLAMQISSTARAVRREGLTYLSLAKLLRIERALKKLEADGAVFEFGVALGGSAIILARHARKAHRKFRGFDVFGMIPPPTSDKDDAKSKDRYKAIVSGQSKGINGETYYGYRSDLYTEVCTSFEKHGLSVDGISITLHKGLFQDTLPLVPEEPIAFAHIDCDWHDPVDYCLRTIADRVSSGGVIVLDDYHDYGGCRTATEAFLSSRRDFVLEPGPNPMLRKA